MTIILKIIGKRSHQDNYLKIFYMLVFMVLNI